MERQGVLYISHGSRVPEATKEAMECIQLAMKKIDIPLQEIVYIEISKPSIEEGIELLVSQGALRIAVVPVLLLSAGHYYKDIPYELEKAKERFPNIYFCLGKPIGVQDQLIDILAERIHEKQTTVSPDIRILLVGRGSRNDETRRDIESIADKLKRKLQVQSIDTGYLAALEPRFEQALHKLLSETNSPVIVVPYLWFTGILMQSMQKKIDSLNSDGKEVILCRQIGNHPAIVAALINRVMETAEFNVNEYFYQGV
ncbi:sirohydrochlorin chelatase [Heyndrickxia acidicola]|uniref:Sirohydrochlorin chelatase n=1 Tax=Heyndrickxia acidicola TaxID=209389 RepID=A0ABU6MLM5_9BACI|nr:sirohydrochlorin chelatase [Heyndrickxia acidicola]MED1205415.1 sirohydrochlorin chelatase [Heyndrickxia acidicola]